jgi:hypothetical protein
MAAAGCEVALRQRICFTCRDLFWICRHCDRATAMAVRSVGIEPIGNSDAWPTSLTSKARRDDSITETVNARIAGAAWSRKKA